MQNSAAREANSERVVVTETVLLEEWLAGLDRLLGDLVNCPLHAAS
jgi:hypothetical protein